MRIVIAPDALKGSLSAVEFCTVVKETIYALAPTIHVTELPLADGGEGTLDCLLAATKGKRYTATVQDPLGRPVHAHYGVLGDGQTAMIELAQASGLPRLNDAEYNPLRTSTYGTGQLIQAALEAGYRKFIIGLGGSATNDAGTGLLRALGMKFYDASGAELADGGAALSQLHTIDATALHPLLAKSSFVIASDVKNPLYGDNGASAVFGPQKGASAQMVQQLDGALRHFAYIAQQQYHVDLQAFTGGGAAGGVGATLQVFLQASYESGIDVVMSATDAYNKIAEADIVLTGEGKLDAQTLAGKVIAGVCRCAKANKVPVIALAGTVQLTAKQLQELGIVTALSIVQGPCTLREAKAHAARWLAMCVQQLMQLYLHVRTSEK